MQLPMKSTRYVAYSALTYLLFCACQGAVPSQPEGQAPASLKNGSNGSLALKGLVEIVNKLDGSRCSGVLLNSAAVLTSAQCLLRILPPGATSGDTNWFNIQLESYDPLNDLVWKRCINQGTRDPQSGNPSLCSDGEGGKGKLLYTYSFSGNADNDVGIILSTGYSYWNTNQSDYADIYMDDFTPTSRPRLQLYGWGNTGTGTAYASHNGSMKVSEVTASHVFLTADSAKSCMGDEGGAWAIPPGPDGSAGELVAIHSHNTKDASGCSTAGSRDYATRLRDKMSWVQSIVGVCDDFTDPAGHAIKSCSRFNCDGAPNSPGAWVGCRGSGCSVCTEALGGYTRYFQNHPNCSQNAGCGSNTGLWGFCSSHCPQPTEADR